MARKKGLGKGLEALFEDNNTAVSASGVELIKISEIDPKAGIWADASASKRRTD